MQGRNMFDDVSDDDFSSSSNDLHSSERHTMPPPAAAAAHTPVREASADAATFRASSTENDKKGAEGGAGYGGATSTATPALETPHADTPKSDSVPQHQETPRTVSKQIVSPDAKPEKPELIIQTTPAPVPATTVAEGKSGKGSGKARRKLMDDTPEKPQEMREMPPPREAQPGDALEPENIRIDLSPSDAKRRKKKGNGPAEEQGESLPRRRTAATAQSSRPPMRVADLSDLSSSSSDGDHSGGDEYLCGLEEYLFPRLDPRLSKWDRSMRHSIPKPNVVEKCFSLLLSVDLRLMIFFMIMVVATVFNIVSIPLSQVDVVGKECYTYWGHKMDCDNASYTTPVSLMTCSAIKDRLRAGAAFAIMTLVLQIAVLFFTIIFIFCFTHDEKGDSIYASKFMVRMMLTVTGAVIFVLQMIAWAIIASIQSNSYCGTKDLAYGVGFGLNVTSWCLNVVAMVLLYVPLRWFPCRLAGE